MRVRVLHVLYEPHPSGISRHVLEIVRLLPELEHHVVFPEHLPGVERSLRELGATPHPLRLDNRFLPRAALARLPWRIRRLAPDVLHLHALETGLFGGVAAHLASALARGSGGRPPRLLFTPQTTAIRRKELWPAYRALLRLLGRREHTWVAVSEGQARALRAWCPGDEVVTIPNWPADLGELPTREAARARLGWPEGARIAASVIRLSAQKDPKTFVRAAAHAPSWTLALCGDGPLRAEVEREAAGVENVILQGRVDGLRDVFAAADALVLASRWEGMSLTLLGALEQGLPCVASRIPGNEDLVLDEETGLLVNTGDAAALGKALERLSADSAWAAELGEAGQLHVLANYSEDAGRERLRALYRVATSLR